MSAPQPILPNLDETTRKRVREAIQNFFSIMIGAKELQDGKVTFKSEDLYNYVWRSTKVRINDATISKYMRELREEEYVNYVVPNKKSRIHIVKVAKYGRQLPKPISWKEKLINKLKHAINGK